MGNKGYTETVARNNLESKVARSVTCASGGDKNVTRPPKLMHMESPAPVIRRLFTLMGNPYNGYAGMDACAVSPPTRART